ncbi:MAG: sarcosine oxidase subunit alpha family protein [Pseudomonadota bacterium]
MAHRLPEGGRLIDRSQPLAFTFDGATCAGFAGDTLASALIANDRVMVGRSFKYHRPRGIIAAGAEEPNALMGIGQGGPKGPRYEPNQRATAVELTEGLAAVSQNHWPSLKYDIGAVNAAVADVAPVFSAGFYYKTFLKPRAAWKHVFEPVIRQAAGLGRAPAGADPDRYEHVHAHVDVLVVGGGIAGMAAARAAAMGGAETMLVEQTAHWGGHALTDNDTTIDGMPAADWAEAEAGRLAALPGLTMRARTMAAGCYDHGWVLLYERLGDHRPGWDGPRHRLWKVRAGRIVIATGAIERPLTFANNDRPGIMLAGAVRSYLALWGVCPGKRAVIVANNDDAYRTALALAAAGAEVRAVIDTRSRAAGALPERVRALGIPVHEGHAITSVTGGQRVEAIHHGRITRHGLIAASEKIHCDLVAMSGGWSPIVHLFSHGGGKLRWDDAAVMFRPAPERGAPIGADGAVTTFCAGAANGHLSTAAVLEDAAAVGRSVAPLSATSASLPETTEAAGHGAGAARGGAVVVEPDEAPVEGHWFSPATAKYRHGTKHFVDFQNDVTAADVFLAAREGYESVEHTKRYTTLGMATDQGKTSNINGLALLADALGVTIPEVGTTTFRPPYTPISLGAIAGAARGPLFKPTRLSPMDAWHAENGADWEPVGDWRRPYRYQQGGEDREASVKREVLNTRQKVGLLDASTLGKIVVAGPDAGRFLDRVYTNMMSTLKVGRCRYGLMCNENGFLFDDGVVVRLGEDRFLCHTTTGGSDRVHGHLEEWLQTEWFDLQVHTVNQTEQWAQVAVAGPEARRLLESIESDIDLSAEALPFMSYAEGVLAGMPARVFRISFSGELGFEVAVPAAQGRALWDLLLERGAAFGAMPYGTEALHVMRAEKGFIMIGDETDGTVTPQDLGLHWAVSKKKDDFIGKRAHLRTDLVRSGRKQLVGLLTENPEERLPDGAHAVEKPDRPAPQRTIGHVTSTYHSPTLGRSIAMALIEDGAALREEGATLSFPVEEGKVIKAVVCDPVFYDREGERLHG